MSFKKVNHIPRPFEYRYLSTGGGTFLSGSKPKSIVKVIIYMNITKRNNFTEYHICTKVYSKDTHWKLTSYLFTDKNIAFKTYLNFSSKINKAYAIRDILR